MLQYFLLNFHFFELQTHYYIRGLVSPVSKSLVVSQTRGALHGGENATLIFSGYQSRIAI